MGNAIPHQPGRFQVFYPLHFVFVDVHKQHQVLSARQARRFCNATRGRSIACRGENHSQTASLTTAGNFSLLSSAMCSTSASTRIYSFRKPASFPGHAPRYEEVLQLQVLPATFPAPAPQQNRPDPGSQPHHMKGAGFRRGCVLSKGDSAASLVISRFLREPH